MSRSNSPWSMVGMLMGAPKLRASSKKTEGRREDKSRSQAVSGFVTGFFGSAETVGVETSATTIRSKARRGANTLTKSTPSIADSLDSRSLAYPPASTGEQENGWTTVAVDRTSTPSEPANQRNESFDLDEDIFDVLSQSVSTDFLHQQSTDFGRDYYDLADFDVEKSRRISQSSKQLEVCVGNQLQIRDAVDEERQQMQQTKFMGLSVQVSEEAGRLTEAERLAKKEAEESVEKIRGLEKIRYEQSAELRKLKEALENGQKDWGSLSRRIEESEERGRDLERRNRQLLDTLQESQKELEDLRKLGIRAGDLAAGFDNTQKEQVALQIRLEESEQSNKNLKEEKRRLVEESQEGRQQLERLRELCLETTQTLENSLVDLQSARCEKDELLTQVARHIAELAAKDKEIEALRNQRAEASKSPNERQLVVLDRRNRMLVDQLRRQSEQLRQLHQNDISLRTLDLSAKGDASSSIVGILDGLHADIFQITAHMTDSLEFSNPFDSATLEASGVLERVKVTMGRELVSVLQALSAHRGDFDPLPVQIGLQACIISCCERIITSWYPGHWDYGDFLAALYFGISGSTPHLATKWRAVTEYQLRKPSDIAVQAEMEEYISKNVIDALVVSGWRKTQSSTKELLSSFREKLGQIARSALRLNAALGDNWEIITIHPDEFFEADKMEDAYGKEEAEGEDRVVCTTDLGLRMAAGNVVLKPKVVLRSMLKEETGLSVSCM